MLALFAGRLGALALAYSKIGSVISGPLLGIVLLATTAKRALAPGALARASVGMAVVWAVMLTTEWSFFYLGPIGLVVTYLSGLRASLFTERPPAEKIRGLVLGQGGDPAPGSDGGTSKAAVGNTLLKC